MYIVIKLVFAIVENGQILNRGLVDSSSVCHWLSDVDEVKYMSYCTGASFYPMKAGAN